ncbi:MAG: AAA family ATPase [Bacillota bacterium]
MHTEIKKISDNIGKVIFGKEDVVEMMLVAILAQGHILFDDVPGIGKTRLANSLARSLGVKFSRIQFTPDLQPADVTGLYFYNQKENEFSFRPGPIETNILLADEINRAVPRTQSSLLEVMEERQVTVEGTTRELEEPFLVVATQNPVELEGTFPLPEAQLDRFLFKLKVGYPSKEVEVEILDKYQQEDPFFNLEPVIEKETIVELQQQVKDVKISSDMKKYITALVRATRKKENVELGLSPRASLAIMRASMARALIQDRDFVIPDDIQAVFPPAAGHRILLKEQANLRGLKAERIIREVLQEIAVPVEGEE